MKINKLLFFSILISLPLLTKAQIKVMPAFPTVDDNITVTYDAASTSGNNGLITPSVVTPVYAHTGVVTTASTSMSDWKHVKYPWATNFSDNTLTGVGSNKHTLSYNIRSYYGIPTGTTVTKLGYVFRNADGMRTGKTAAGGDIFYDVWDGTSFQSKIVCPIESAITVQLGNTIAFEGATSLIGNLSLRVDGILVQSGSDIKSMTHSIVATTPGLHTVEFKVNNGSTPISKIFTFNVTTISPIANPPVGVKVGANDNGDGSVTFVLKAPNKPYAYLMGDFNGWAYTDLMNRSADGTTFWLTKSGFTLNQDFKYQYNVDGLRIADPLSTLILDQSADGSISSATYPNKPTYPGGQSGFVSVFRPGKTPYAWTTSNVIHDKKDLVIYELLVRDFGPGHSYQDLIDRVMHLKNLGVNAIELMPVNEFEGNESWGYNPNFHMALDKYYGPESKLKEFINLCHQNNISVILDVVFNHAYGSSPLVQMYFSGTVTTPESPWFNPISPHDFSVGHDFKHGSNTEIYTNEYMDRCLKYWLQEFKVDGFRFDLSKGFTQNTTRGNIAAWSAYDQSRVDNWQRIYDVVQGTTPGAYCILEHLGSNGEETELANRGMMLWKKMNVPYKQAAMGYSDNALSGASPQSLGWTDSKFDKALTFMESHDEKRLVHEIKASGNAVSGYDTKNHHIAMKRVELASAFFFTVPGPKMMWQGAELGDEANSGESNTANNPINWSSLSESNRNRLYKVMANIINLRTQYPSVFRTNNHNQADLNTGYLKHFHLSPDGATLRVAGAPDFYVTIIGNFDVVAQNITPYFQRTGTWYDYLSGQTINVANTTDQIYLQPGEYHIYTGVSLGVPPQGYTPFTNANLALPVELMTFNAKLIQNNNALLVWVTASEKNNSHFELERSTDGKDFTKVGEVKGKGNSTTQSKYEFTDKNLTNGTHYYRLRQVDFDGKNELSHIVSVSSNKNIKFKIYPNPTTDKLFIQSENTKGAVSVIDQLGRAVLSYPSVPSEINISVLPSGIYFLKIDNERIRFVKK
jgi:1,4-alpha-glucan branching enzyme